MSTEQGFPWALFTGNTLRPMMVDVLRAAGHERPGTARSLTKDASIALLQKVEKHGLAAALQEDLPADASASTSKRKQRAQDDSVSTEPAPKRGRGRQNVRNAEQSASAPAPRTRSKAADEATGQGLLTRRQAAQARGDNVPPARTWRASVRAPRKPKAKASAVEDSGSVSAPPRSVFDGVVLAKRPQSYAGKGKAREQVDEPAQDGGAGSDEDAEGEIVEEGMDVEGSPLENSNKENDRTFFELANAETTDGEVDAEGEESVPPEEIGSPAPRITIEPTHDQIEDARNNDFTMHIGSPAPEITIEPLANGDEAEVDPPTANSAENGVQDAELLGPQINQNLRAGSVELNPEYSIEVFSPTSAQHDSDDETWSAPDRKPVNGSSGLSVANAGASMGVAESTVGVVSALDAVGMVGVLDALD